MKRHTKIYFDYMGYSGHEFMPCEMCGAMAVDIHHISPKGMGGRPDKDTIRNLIALCRECHRWAHESKITQETMFGITKMRDN